MFPDLERSLGRTPAARPWSGPAGTGGGPEGSAPGRGSPAAGPAGSEVTLMVFTGPQCPWCRAFEPVVRSVTRRCGTSALRWADLSTDAGAAEAREHGVQGIPTSLLLGPGGEVLGRLDGYVPEEDLLAFLRASGEGACAED